MPRKFRFRDWFKRRREPDTQPTPDDPKPDKRKRILPNIIERWRKHADERRNDRVEITGNRKWMLAAIALIIGLLGTFAAAGFAAWKLFF